MHSHSLTVIPQLFLACLYCRYTFEEHIVETQDGFQLAMHRIPNGKDGGYSDLGEDEDKGDEKPRDAVLIVHALFDSSSSYVAGPSDKCILCMNPSDKCVPQK